MAELDLIMPMAGRGSRFEREGFALPKPLIALHGQPLFWWAVQSLATRVPLGRLVFVVLREHIERFQIDRQILQRYAHAHVEALDQVTEGAAQTAAAGVQALGRTDVPLAINDCDHAFDAGGLLSTLDLLDHGGADAALMGFRSTDPAFSYARLDGQAKVVGTVEKQTVSPFAIAGCYLFRRPQTFLDYYEAYRHACPYPELYMSGIYNTLITAGGTVAFHELERHVPFGTPSEFGCVTAQDLAFLGAPGMATSHP